MDAAQAEAVAKQVKADMERTATVMRSVEEVTRQDIDSTRKALEAMRRDEQRAAADLSLLRVRTDPQIEIAEAAKRTQETSDRTARAVESIAIASASEAGATGTLIRLTRGIKRFTVVLIVLTLAVLGVGIAALVIH